MAVKTGIDPLTYRQEMAKGGSDLAKILTKLREVSKRDQPLAAGKGRGVAQYEFFAGHAGSVVEVFKHCKSLKIDKVYGVIDMGTIVNPFGVEAQVQSALTTAITAATKNGISFESEKQNNQTTMITQSSGCLRCHLLKCILLPMDVKSSKVRVSRDCHRLRRC